MGFSLGVGELVTISYRLTHQRSLIWPLDLYTAVPFRLDRNSFRFNGLRRWLLYSIVLSPRCPRYVTIHFLGNSLSHLVAMVYCEVFDSTR